MKCKRWLALLLALGLLFSLCPVWAAEEPQETIIELGLCTAEPTSGDFNGYLVKLREDAIVPYSVSRSAQALGDGIYLVESEADAYALAGADAVEILEPNYRVELYSAVNDSYYSEQWYLNGTYGLSIETAWAAGLTGTGVKVAVLDTGLRPTHADIRYTSHVQPVYNATGDGYTGGYCPTAEGFHGTMVAGVISATANNGYGIAGAAYNATLYPVRVFDQNGYGYISYIVAGIDYAIEQEVDVINMSLGLTSYSPSLNAAVQRALAAGIIVVAAVGNDGNSVLSYPAACSGVVGVGATESDGTVATYSQKNESVWISAPGSNIFGLYTSSDYTFASSSGTSFASPCVAALAVLAKQYANQNGQDLTPARFANLLRLTAQDRGEEGYDTSYGWGAVDAAHMLAGMEARTIQFQLNGGTLPDGAVTTYIPYYGQTLSLPIPTREDHNFAGWYTSSDFQGSTVSALVTEDHLTPPTLYAKWEETNHRFIKIDTQPATCTDNGLDTFACEYCGETKTEAIPATGHSWGDWTVTQAPAIGQTGQQERHCQNQGCLAVETEILPALVDPCADGHRFINYTSDQNATCTQDGTETAQCENGCGTTHTRTVDGSATGHSWNDEGTVTTQASCVADGVMTYTCKVCIATRTEAIPATGHSWNEGTVTTPVSCTTDGVKTYTCSVCHETRTEIIPATGHTNITIAHVEPTCTTPGVTGGTYCSACGSGKAAAEASISALGHDYVVSSSTEATCTEGGTITYHCTREGCDSSYTETISVTAHKEGEGVVTTEPTCVNPGVLTYFCTVCGQAIRTEVIPATGHSPIQVTTPATCIQAGSVQSVCRVCQTVLETTSVLDIIDHAWNEGEVTTQPTCLEAGVRTYTCLVCAGTRTEAIPATGHSWGEWTVTQTPAIDQEGQQERHCQNQDCLAVDTETLPALVDPCAAGHSWDEGAVTTPATCEAGGVTTYTCTVCGGTRTEAIPATGHSWDGGTVTTPATCTTSGTLLLTCTRCGETRSQSISPLGHSYSGGSCTRCGASDPNDRPVTQWPSSQPSEVKPLAKEPEPEPDPNTVTETNPDGSVTTTVTDPDTGTVTAVTQYTDGSSLEVETLSDGTVNTTQTRADQTVIQISQAPEQDPEVSVTLPQDVTDTVVTVALPDDSSRVAVDRETGDPIPLCTYLDGVLLVAVDDSVSFTLTALSSDYDDVSARSWYHDAVDFVSTRNLFQGYKDNTFQPKRNTSRAMVFTVLARLSNAELETGKRWYTGAMNWAMDQGISDGSRPGDDVTRQELITLLWRWAGTPEAPELEGYTDLGQVSSYARSAMAWAVDAGILTGRTDTTLAPVNTATRAETATIFQRLINYLVTQRADQL